MMKVVMMVGAFAMGMNCLAANFGPGIPYLGRFLYDSETGSIRLGSVVFLVVLVVAIAWTQMREGDKRKNNEGADKKGVSQFRQFRDFLRAHPLLDWMFLCACGVGFIALVLVCLKYHILEF